MPLFLSIAVGPLRHYLGRYSSPNSHSLLGLFANIIVSSNLINYNKYAVIKL